MFAIIKTGGKQYRVSEKEKIKLEKIDGKEKSKVTFDKVLLISDGEKLKIGKPKVDKSSVEAKIISQGKAKKVKVFKFKPKKRYKRSQGHRQQFTEVEITKIKF